MPPSVPSNPSPVDEETNVSLTTSLNWDSIGATSYDIYFGTSSPPPLYGYSFQSHYDLPTLNYGTTYYWQVVAKNAGGNTFGSEWEFTTKEQYTLSISTTVGGTTDPVPGTYYYENGTTLEIKAISDALHKFYKWSGNIPIGHELENPITITMDSNKIITAEFIAEILSEQIDNYRGVLAADVDYDGRDELVVDYGTMGIYLYDPYTSPKWTRLSGANPDFMIVADSDGNNTAEIFAYFEGENAIHKWEWVSGDADGQWSWNWVNGYKCDYMFPADIEDDGKEEIVLGLRSIDSSAYYVFLKDYNSGTPAMHLLYSGQSYAGWPVAFGTSDDEIVSYRDSMYWWDYISNDSDFTDNWTRMITSDPDLGDTLVANFDDDLEEELIVDIINQLWVYNYSSSPKWSRLNAATVLDIRPWPQMLWTDDELVVSFLSPNGLWMYDAQATPKWQCLNGLTPDYDGGYVEVFNADGDTDWDIAVDYSNQGIGLWKYDYNGSPKWTSMNGNAADYMVRADLNGDGDHELLVKFSSVAGLWKWDDDTTPKWQRINGANPD